MRVLEHMGNNIFEIEKLRHCLDEHADLIQDIHAILATDISHCTLFGSLAAVALLPQTAILHCHKLCGVTESAATGQIP